MENKRGFLDTLLSKNKKYACMHTYKDEYLCICAYTDEYASYILYPYTCEYECIYIAE
jgi:hypothetical protein